MSKHASMQWNLRQVMADRGIFQTSELVPLLAERGVHISREHVYRLVTKAPQRVNLEIRGCQMACVNGRVHRRAGCACSWKETYPYVRPEADLEVQDHAGA